MAQDLTSTPIKQYFLDAAPADCSFVGVELAKAMVADAKARFKQDLDPNILAGCLKAWNARWSSPFSESFLIEVAKTPARDTPKSKPRRKKIDYAHNMHGEPL